MCVCVSACVCEIALPEYLQHLIRNHMCKRSRKSAKLIVTVVNLARFDGYDGLVAIVAQIFQPMKSLAH